MVNQMSNLRSAAANFVNMFNPGTDELGLVILSGSSYVAYPNPTQTPNYKLRRRGQVPMYILRMP